MPIAGCGPSSIPVTARLGTGRGVGADRAAFGDAKLSAVIVSTPTSKAPAAIAPSMRASSNCSKETKRRFCIAMHKASTGLRKLRDRRQLLAQAAVSVD
jgi:hypothetical protein